MSANNIRVRFAPSPTGYLHIGGARTALFNYLFAKNKGGKFLLRIEDTDKKRSTKEAIDAILQGLDWLGLERDEADIFQSQNLKRHQEVAQTLLDQGKAYYCYTSADELEKLRQEAQENGKIFKFQSPWRDIDPKEAKNLPENQEKSPVIRLKAPRNEKITIHDLVQGDVTIDSNEIDDLVILRSDQTPTYMLSVVVDDHDMQISHVIRGDDHLTNSFKQKVIFDALEWENPAFAHISLIHGPDGAKMSKRHGATSVIEYKELGYLPSAMRNYLLRLGFSDGDKEIISDQEAIQIFDFDKVGKSPARFDFDKLGFLNKHYIKQLSNQNLLSEISYFLTKKPNQNEEERLILALNFLKEKPVTLKEIADSCAPYFDNFSLEFNDGQKELLTSKSDLLKQISEILANLNQWNHDSIKNALMDFAKNQNIKIKDFGPALRLALTFSNSSAGGIFDVVEALGKEEVLKRF